MKKLTNGKVPNSLLDEVRKLKVYRETEEFTEYTTGKQTYSEEMMEGVILPRSIYRVENPTFLKKLSINKVN